MVTGYWLLEAGSNDKHAGKLLYSGDIISIFIPLPGN